MSPLAVSLIDLLKLSSSPPPKQPGTNWVVVIGVVGSLVTIGGAFIGLAGYSDRRKQRKRSHLVNELLDEKLDAEEIEKDTIAAKEKAEEAKDELTSLREVRDDLSDQIALVPEEVDRLVQARQLEQLAARLSKDFKEYASIEDGLRERKPGALDLRIRDVIEHEMLPLQNRLERRNAYILALVVLSLALSLSPIRISYLIYSYFYILGGSPNWASDDPAWMIVIGSTIIALLIFAATPLSSMVQKYVAALGKYRFIIGLAFALIVSIILGYYWRDYAVENGCTPYPCGYPRFPYTTAGIVFNIAPLLGGLLLVSIVSLNRNRAIKRKLLARTRVSPSSAPGPDSRESTANNPTP
jgi:hypothetical protein